MPSTTAVSPEYEQEHSYRQLEQEIGELLEGDRQAAALGFVAYLRRQAMSPRPWLGPRYWRIPYRSYYLAGLVLDQARWRVWFFSAEYSGAFEPEFVQAVQAHVKACHSCTDDCPKGSSARIFGREYGNTCYQFPLQFENPTPGTLDHVKRLLAYCKQVIAHSDSWHAR